MNVLQRIVDYLALLLKGVHQIIFLQEQIMADLATVNSAVSDLVAARQAQKEHEQNKPATVLQSDLDPVVEQIKSVTADIQADTNAG